MHALYTYLIQSFWWNWLWLCVFLALYIDHGVLVLSARGWLVLNGFGVSIQGVRWWRRWGALPVTNKHMVRILLEHNSHNSQTDIIYVSFSESFGFDSRSESVLVIEISIQLYMLCTWTKFNTRKKTRKAKFVGNSCYMHTYVSFTSLAPTYVEEHAHTKTKQEHEENNGQNCPPFFWKKLRTTL